MGDASIILSAVATFATAISAVMAVMAFCKSVKTQKKISENTKKQMTIEAFNYLQEQVLDKFVSFSKSDVSIILDNMEHEDVKEAYNDCRAMIAKCEHFAVGVNTEIYDFETVERLGGMHLVYLYDKLKPIILETRKSTKGGEVYYKEFEMLANNLAEKLA